MKIRSIISVASIVALMSSTSSCVKNELATTTHPEGAKVTVSPDWSALSSTITRPAAYYIQINDLAAVRVTASTYTFDSIFKAGNYRLHLYNNPAGFVAPQQGSVVKLADQRISDYYTPARPGESYVVSGPAELDYLFTGTLDTILYADRDYTLPVKIVQRTGRIDFTLTPGEGSATAWNDVEFPFLILTGVASTIDLRTGAISAPDSTLVRLTRNSAGNWVGSARVLGIVTTAAQQLRVKMNNVGSSSGLVLVDSVIDVRTRLLPINSNRITPIALTQSLRITYPSSTPGFDTDTNPWDTIPGGSGNAYEE